jgi:hypothetical protein
MNGQTLMKADAYLAAAEPDPRYKPAATLAFPQDRWRKRVNRALSAKPGDLM